MRTDKDGRVLCDGTNCSALSSGEVADLIEVPEWRRPSNHPRQAKAYELITTAHYCKEHEQVAN
jgi:hypothetical protein